MKILGQKPPKNGKLRWFRRICKKWTFAGENCLFVIFFSRDEKCALFSSAPLRSGRFLAKFWNYPGRNIRLAGQKKWDKILNDTRILRVRWLLWPKWLSGWAIGFDGAWTHKDGFDSRCARFFPRYIFGNFDDSDPETDHLMLLLALRIWEKEFIF